jgi:hypothetical protein
MKHFESSGLWFPANDSSIAVGGTLRYDSEGLNLTLLGSFREGWAAGVERYPTIRGVVDENPYGTFVTLFDCLRTRSRFNTAGFTSETIRCGKATIGSAYFPDGPSQIPTLEVIFSYSNDWVGQSGINVEINRDTYSMNYTEPKMFSFQFGDMKLSLVTWARPKWGVHHASLNEKTVIRVAPIRERSPTELGSDPVPILQNLLTFATDTPNEIEDLAYHGREDSPGIGPSYHVVFEPIFRLKSDKQAVHQTDMLFTFGDSHEHNLNIFQNWLEFTRKNRSFCTVYFANLYTEPRYLNDRFVSLMQAFTLLTTSISEVSGRTKLFLSDVEASLKSHYSDEERDLLGHIIPTGPELEMPYHLLRLLQENADTMGPLIEDMPGFVKSVSDTLAFFERRSEGKRPYLQGASLLHAVLKIRTLIKIVVLKKLGFDELAVRSLVMRNNRINFLRTV